MLEDVILRQKFEKERLLGQTYVERDKLKSSQRWLNTSMVKVIMGPRRAGKSVFAFMLLKDTPFMFLNFDDEVFFSLPQINTQTLMRQLHSAYGDLRTVFFDEVQNLPNWQIFVNRLQREGYNVVLTGSNANLLSSELASALTGRHIPIEIMPFNFREFLRAEKFQIDGFLSLPNKQAQLLRLVEKYMQEGGFPEVVVKGFEAKEYLRVLFDSILLKDVVKRHRIRHSVEMMKLSSYLVDNFASRFSSRKAKAFLSLRSTTTVEKFLSYLQEAYLVFPLSGLSFKAKRRLRSPRKVYVVDNGYINAKSVRFSPDRGRLMENLVFTELVKRGYRPNLDIFYYRTRNNREVDFAIKEGTRVKQLIQVSLWKGSEDTKRREIKALVEGAEELGAEELLVITWDSQGEVKIKGREIKLLPLWKWLLWED